MEQYFSTEASQEVTNYEPWTFEENGFTANISLTNQPMRYELPDRTIVIPAGIPVAKLDLTPAGIFWHDAKNRTYVLSEGIRSFGLFLDEINRRAEQMPSSMRPQYLYGYTHTDMANFARTLGFAVISHPNEVGADRVVGRLEDVQRTYTQLRQEPRIQKLLSRAQSTIPQK